MDSTAPLRTAFHPQATGGFRPKADVSALPPNRGLRQGSMSPDVVGDRYCEKDRGTDNCHGLSCEVCPEHAAQCPQKEADKQCSVEDVLPNFDVIHTAFCRHIRDGAMSASYSQATDCSRPIADINRRAIYDLSAPIGTINAHCFIVGFGVHRDSDCGMRWLANEDRQ